MKIEYKFYREQIFPREEDVTCEFKEIKGKNPLDTIKNHCDEYMVGFLNQGSSGSIFWGVRDDGTVQGIALNVQDRDSIRRKVSDQICNIEPKPGHKDWDLVFHQVFNEDNSVVDDLYVVELIVLPPRTKSCYFTSSGEVFLKTQASNRKIKGLELQEFIISKELGGVFNIQNDVINFLSFINVTFPILKWIYEPVPTDHRGYVYHKMQEFFYFYRFLSEEINSKQLGSIADMLLRCATNLSPGKNIEASKYLNEKMEYVHFQIYDYAIEHEIIDSTTAFLSQGSGKFKIRDRLISINLVLIRILEKDSKSVSISEKKLFLLLKLILEHLQSEIRDGCFNEIPESVISCFANLISPVYENYFGCCLPSNSEPSLLQMFKDACPYNFESAACWQNTGC